MQRMTEQVQTVIDAAERAAEAIRYDAEEQARRHLAEAQRKADRLTAERVGLISELTDDLVRHAANVRDHSEQMVRALEDAIHSVTDKLEQSAMTDTFPSAAPPGPSLPLGQPLGPSESTVVGRQDPNYDPSQAAVRAGGFAGSAAPSVPRAPVAYPGNDAAAEPDPEPSQAQQPEIPFDAILHATRLAANDTDPAAIASELRNRFGIENPDPIVDRILGNP